SRYKPQPSSCFGQGTLVLMADGQTKPIESIQLGDEVQSNLGPRKVVLIEQPKRANRTLYSLNQSTVFATSGHPFRAAGADNVMRYALDPWLLIDGIPTMTVTGVGKLEEKTQLLGLNNGEPTSIEINQIEPHPPTDKDSDELVYDLLLENWEKGHAAYYVGGPDIFFAVDAETADPLHETEVTVAIVAAMEMVKSACWEHVKDPQQDIPHFLAAIDISDLPDLARKASRSFVGREKKWRPSIPTQDFYLRDGDWDAHTSFLEYYLVRDFGRWIRSELLTGWRSDIVGRSLGDHLVVGLFDLELIGEPMIANTDISIELEAKGIQLIWSDVPKCVTLPASAKPIWTIRFDRSVDMGRALATAPSPMLAGKIRQNQQVLGHFRAAIAVDGQPTPRTDYFIFNPDGFVIGRICLDLRWLSKSDLRLEADAAQHWTRRHIMSLAIALGRQLGYKLLAQFEAHSMRSI
ncbi:MAG: hint domain-containing protein, partial [Spirulina sp. SIO3F2]|nr:hint domain-containing protein [Spirulina sp. SIO3F2]